LLAADHGFWTFHLLQLILRKSSMKTHRCEIDNWMINFSGCFLSIDTKTTETCQHFTDTILMYASTDLTHSPPSSSLTFEISLSHKKSQNSWLNQNSSLGQNFLQHSYFQFIDIVFMVKQQILTCFRNFGWKSAFLRRNNAVLPTTGWLKGWSRSGSIWCWLDIEI